MKTINNIQRICVIGAGTMGAGIAQISAACGFETSLFDLNETVLEKAKASIAKNYAKAIELKKMTQEQSEVAFQKIHFTVDISELIGDVMIEAVIEKLEVKRDIFSKLASINADDTILATNTSSIPITQIAFGLPNPERVVGMHFFNPPHLMKLVEIISGASTSKEVADVIYQLAEKLGKKAVMCNDSAGFIVNRVARHYYVEALKMMEENVAPFEVIDELMESVGFKMGPFRLMDLIGVDTNFSVTSSMYAQFHQDAKFRPSRIQQQKVDAGHWGRKSGRGFYIYER